MEGIADTFLNPYQAGPLDLYTDEFYTNRKTEIKARLKLIKESTNEVRKWFHLQNSEANNAACISNRG